MSDNENFSVDVVDLQSFAARVRADIAEALQPAADSVDGDFETAAAGGPLDQALGNNALNPDAQLIGAAIELNILEAADHLRKVINSMTFMAALAEVIAADFATIDEQNAMDVAEFGDYAAQALIAVSEEGTPEQP